MTTDLERRVAAGDLAFLGEEELAAFVVAQRWFGAKSREVVGAHVLEAVPLRTTAPPLLVLALVEVRFQPGTHDVYQLLVGLRPAGEDAPAEHLAEVDGWVAYEALADPVLSRELVHLVRGATTVPAEDGSVEFRPVEGLAEHGAELWEARPVGAEQSNTSIVFGEELILKAYRRLEAGINPELELLRFLTERDFRHIAPLVGWYALSGRVMDATLGVLQRYVAGERDGWSLALESLSGDGDPNAFLARVGRLGEVTGALHVALASDPADPSFAAEEPSAEALAILTATIDEEIEQLFLDLPEQDVLGPIAGRGEEVREQLRLLTHIGAGGRVIRHHGDYHLGQVLATGDDWIVLDFEGEPARALPERRRKRSPLRDVAGMLRSFAYAASAAAIVHGAEPPPGWEARAREEFLAAYLPLVEPSGLLPAGADATDKLLAVFELEKAVYELRYELDNRPEWVEIPVAGIVRLLEERAPA